MNYCMKKINKGVTIDKSKANQFLCFQVVWTATVNAVSHGISKVTDLITVSRSMIIVSCLMIEKKRSLVLLVLYMCESLVGINIFPPLMLYLC